MRRRHLRMIRTLAASNRRPSPPRWTAFSRPTRSQQRRTTAARNTSNEQTNDAYKRPYKRPSTATSAMRNAYANAPTNATDAPANDLHTDPPITPLCALARASTRPQTRLRYRSARVRRLSPEITHRALRTYQTPWLNPAQPMQDHDMTEHLPAKTPKKERFLPRKITRAIEGLCTGEYRNITIAAQALGYTRSHLSKALRTPRAQALVEARTPRNPERIADAGGGDVATFARIRAVGED
jgi:hypothetical protein